MKSQQKIRRFGLTNFQIAILILLALADCGLVLILIRLLGIDMEMLMAYYLIALFPLIIIFSRNARTNSVIKRGIPVWRDDVPKDMKESLQYVWQDIENENGFIRVEGNRRLVGVSQTYYRTALPYVAYIDLGIQSSKIEYRASLVGVLFLLPFLILFSLLVVPMVALNHFIERAAIRGFISDYTQVR